MGLGKAIKKGWSKTMGRGPLSAIGFGKGGVASSFDMSKGSLWDKASRELGHAVGYLTGANAMQDLIDAQNAANAQAQANAQRQASINAGNVQQVSQAGTEDAVSKLLKKRTALQRSIRTTGQQRLGD
jgi:hypothetical protein